MLIRAATLRSHDGSEKRVPTCWNNLPILCIGRVALCYVGFDSSCLFYIRVLARSGWFLTRLLNGSIVVWFEIFLGNLNAIVLLFLISVW
jgi:hypothetical protein